LDQILVQCPEAQVYCLIRASNPEQGKDRILKGMIDAHIQLDESKLKRIVPVAGDLAKPYLGINEAEFAELGRKVDAIYHSGAYVHGVLSYSLLRAANVGGTMEVLRLAALGAGGTVLHYVSTLSVLDGSKDAVNEDYQIGKLLSRITQYSGYAQSKWLAEMLVQIAMLKGLPVVVYRPGTISGHSKTGVSNKSDFINRLLCGMVQTGHYPQGSEDSLINMAPVDYVASALVELSRNKDNLGSAFHLCSPDSLPLQTVLKYVEAYGISLQPTTYLEWLHMVKQDKANVLWPLSSSFREQEDGTLLAGDTVYSCTRCVKGLKNVQPEQFAITEKIFHRYLAFYEMIGFLYSPTQHRGEQKGD